ncbi:MAG: enoyl-CoA hydratase/isomerase family protein [Xanthomonadales bacterium]|nr:enoyl-CoA hydratase/isomerase family protein [Xanthomonadales bacterium]
MPAKAQVLYVTEGPLAWLKLNRPDKLNAVGREMIADLNAALDKAEANEQVRVILVEGAGRAFSAGFDLDMGVGDELEHATPEQLRTILRRELRNDFDIIMRFWDCPKITIAAVHGYCLGSAMEIALACDLTLASDDCRFGAPEVQFGSGIVALLLPWFCGPKRAKELLLTGTDKVTATQAEAWGLVNRVVDAAELHNAARELALSIAQNDQLAVRLTKQAINCGFDTAGMRKALLDALELDVEIESTETPESKIFNEMMERDGVRAAIAWRKSQFG